MKIKDITDRINQKNRYILPMTQGLLTIALVIAVAVISIRLLTGNTLADYAEANPDKAYGVTSEPVKEPIEENNTAVVTETSDDIKESGISSDISGEDGADPVLGDADTDISSGQNDSADADTDISYSQNDSLPKYNRSVMIHFYDPGNSSPDRTDCADGFYYEPLNDQMKEYITGISYPVIEQDNLSDDISSPDRNTDSTLNITTDPPAVTYEDLNYVGILYYDFNGVVQAGELICNQKIAKDLAEIFHELYIAEYQLDSVVLIDNYNGDDTASMCADNTSCFNYRVVDGTASLSKHAYGLAIDINPFYNPYIVFGKGEGGSDYISPPGSEIYADRTSSFAYKIDENDLCYRLFISHGFKWGGNWNSCKDYQHFQKEK